MNRRGFLGAILAAAAAPAVLSACNVMRVRPIYHLGELDTSPFLPEIWTQQLAEKFQAATRFGDTVSELWAGVDPAHGEDATVVNLVRGEIGTLDRFVIYESRELPPGQDFGRSSIVAYMDLQRRQNARAARAMDEIITKPTVRRFYDILKGRA